MKRNPILVVKNAGFGETPVPDNALLKPGQTIEAIDENTLEKKTGVVLAVVPVGTPIEYAMADQADPKQPRPLMLAAREPHDETVYAIDFTDRPDNPEIFKHSVLLAGYEKANNPPLSDKE